MKRYFDPEYYCDICGRQVKAEHDLFKVDIEHGGLVPRIWNLAYDPIDVCEECKTEIADFIKDMMKRERRKRNDSSSML